MGRRWLSHHDPWFLFKSSVAQGKSLGKEVRDKVIYQVAIVNYIKISKPTIPRLQVVVINTKIFRSNEPDIRKTLMRG